MKCISDLRNQLTIDPQEVGSHVKYLKSLPIDWDVYLPSHGKNLQRDFVWNIEQKRALIDSIIVGRHIPHLAIINIIDPNDNQKDINQIIDGKQRLSSIFEFIDDKFTIVLEGDEYLYSELPIDYRNAISRYHIRYYVVNELWGKPITDDEKITWFKFINFAGTPQDVKHIESLK